MDNSDNDLANYFSSVDQDPSYLEHIFLPNIADYNQSRAIPKPITPENTSTENEQSSTETKRRRLANEEESTTKPTTTVVPVEGRHTRESEQRRRERINQCFDILKNLLPTSPDVNNKKITKEGILIETIKYIESLKGEVVTMKTPSPIFNDPLTRLPLSTDEIQSGFNFLLQDTMNKFSSINSKSQLVSVQRSCTMILELADKNSYDDIKLSAYLLSALYYLVLSYNPKVMLSILDKAMPVYENLEKQKKTFTFMAADIGVTLLSMYIFALLPMGYFDLVDTYSQKLATLKKNQDNIGHFLSSNTVFIKYWKGEHVTVPEAKEIHESIVVFPSWKSYGDTIYTVSLAQTTKTHEEKMRITETINQCVIETINIFGTFIEPTVRGIAIQGYLQTDTQKSLNEIDYMLNMIEQLGITGLFPHSDYLIMKSFVLLSNNNAGTSVEEVSQKENEAEILLRYAVKVAYDNQFYISAVKALMILIKLYQKRGLQDQLLQSLSSVQQLVSLLIKRSNVPIKLLTKAQEVLNQFNL